MEHDLFFYRLAYRYGMPRWDRTESRPEFRWAAAGPSTPRPRPRLRDQDRHHLPGQTRLGWSRRGHWPGQGQGSS
jgi:hypothetical protein